jgi:alpha-D-ribose 1-methylphosphonate 5-phosphate C-P lyase
MTRIPDIEEDFARQVTAFMQKIRAVDFLKKPGVSETLDWAQALMTMHHSYLEEEVVDATIGCILKYQEDIKKFKEEIWSHGEERSQYLSSTG